MTHAHKEIDIIQPHLLCSPIRSMFSCTNRHTSSKSFVGCQDLLQCCLGVFLMLFLDLEKMVFDRAILSEFLRFHDNYSNVANTPTQDPSALQCLNLLWGSSQGLDQGGFRQHKVSQCLNLLWGSAQRLGLQQEQVQPPKSLAPVIFVLHQKRDCISRNYCHCCSAHSHVPGMLKRIGVGLSNAINFTHKRLVFCA